MNEHLQPLKKQVYDFLIERGLPTRSTDIARALGLLYEADSIKNGLMHNILHMMKDEKLVRQTTARGAWTAIRREKSMTPTYVLTWNPAKWTFSDYPQALTDMRELGFYVRQWSCVSRHPQPGDAFIMVKVGTEGRRGIFASGTILSVPFINRDWERPSGTRQYVLLRFDCLTDFMAGDILECDYDTDIGFVPQASGCRIAEDLAPGVLKRFRDFAAKG